VVPPAFTADCGLIGCGVTAGPAPLRQRSAPAEATSAPISIAEGSDMEGISPSLINSLSPTGNSLDEQAGYWSPRTSFNGLDLALIIQDGMRLTSQWIKNIPKSNYAILRVKLTKILR